MCRTRAEYLKMLTKLKARDRKKLRKRNKLRADAEWCKRKMCSLDKMRDKADTARDKAIKRRREAEKEVEDADQRRDHYAMLMSEAY